jgi:hypothetical protein
MSENENKVVMTSDRNDLKVSVSARALKEVLAALVGSTHTVHELMITRGLAAFSNPIDQLIDEFNTEIQKHTLSNKPTTDDKVESKD